MAKEIRWSIKADQDKFEIIEYWTKRNKSSAYSHKLLKLFKFSAEQAAKAPNAGSPTKYPFVRTKVVRNYLVYYLISSTYIEIVTIWDSRRNPKKFKL